MEINKDISNKLLVYQIDHTKNVISILSKNGAALDASSTGTGKTYTSIAVCAHLGYKPIIICPKSVISSWTKVCAMFNVKPFFIVNYETIKFEKYYVNGKRTKCPYIKFIEDTDDDKWYYEWNFKNIKDKLIFIFDEVHKCADYGTENGQLLYSAKKYSLNNNIPILILSATIADRIDRFKLFFYVLNFIAPDSVKKQNLSYIQYINIMSKWISRDAKPFYKIHTMLYPDRASLMRSDAIPNFPETLITANPYSMGSKRESEIEKEYSMIADELNNLKEKTKKDRGNVLVKVLRAHQKIELLKIPLFVELANDLLENGYSVVIFVNYTQTLERLATMLNTSCLIHGEQSQEKRELNIASFQNNTSKIIIANILAGNVGISLHDLHGGHPRASLISPTWSSTNLIQALGRTHRSEAKTKSIQHIIYIANTIEEKISERVKIKLKDINTLNNGDVDINKVLYVKERKIA